MSSPPVIDIIRLPVPLEILFFADRSRWKCDAVIALDPQKSFSVSRKSLQLSINYKKNKSRERLSPTFGARHSHDGESLMRIMAPRRFRTAVPASRIIPRK